MKRTKQCPKCQSRHVGFSVGRGPDYPHTVGITRELVRCEKWLCVACGFHEVYVTELDGVDWPAILDHYYGPIEKGPYR